MSGKDAELRDGEEQSSTTMATATYARMRRDIISGDLAAGQRLRIREICHRYGASLSPVREALNRLSAEQLVVLNDQRGFTVAGASKNELVELTRTRIWLNELALRRSIKLGGQEWEEAVLVAFHRLSRVPRFISGDGQMLKINPEWDAPHRAFHASLLAACDSSLLRGYCEQLFDRADRYRNLARAMVLADRPDLDEHHPIMRAAIERRADEAVELLTAHVSTTTDIILQRWYSSPL
jgi:DNA-binding GntR family transcriptional regulator